jgi:hypothetical protein
MEEPLAAMQPHWSRRETKQEINDESEDMEYWVIGNTALHHLATVMRRFALQSVPQKGLKTNGSAPKRIILRCAESFFAFAE